MRSSQVVRRSAEPSRELARSSARRLLCASPGEHRNTRAQEDPLSRRRWRGAWLEVATEDVTLPNGKEIELDIVRHPGASAVVPFVSDTEVVLIRQYRYVTGGTLWEIPAGKLDPGESPDACARRELEEEAGFRAGRLESLGGMWCSPGFTDEWISLYAAFDLEPVPQRLQDDEVIELHRMPFRQALELVWSGQLPDAKSALALLKAAKLLEQTDS
jgi:ADP-ribose pyrophosphatase